MFSQIQTSSGMGNEGLTKEKYPKGEGVWRHSTCPSVSLFIAAREYTPADTAPEADPPHRLADSARSEMTGCAVPRGNVFRRPRQRSTWTLREVRPAIRPAGIWGTSAINTGAPSATMDLTAPA